MRALPFLLTFLCQAFLLTGVQGQPAAAEPVVPVARHAKRMPASFTGFAVELTASERPLDLSFPLFKNFGNIHYDKPARGRYTYLIPLGFTKRPSVDKYLADVILPRVPEATIIEYYNGRRQGGDDARRKRRYRFD